MDFPKIKGLDRYLRSDDIVAFYKKSEKAKNDEYNKIRECIIGNIRNIPNFPIVDEYLEQWEEIYLITIDLLESICNSNDFIIEQKGGRTNNYDFKLVAGSNTFLIELKTNNIPQIASIYCNNPIVNELDYPNYFYDNYLDKLIVGVPMIGKEDYIKNLYKTKPEDTDFPEFFGYLKLNCNDALVKKSIKDFLENNRYKLNLSKITDYLIKNHLHKKIIIYNTTLRVYDELDDFDDDNLQCISISDKIMNDNTIIIKTKTFNFKFLLRWKNHKGCLGPAWQVSYEKR